MATTRLNYQADLDLTKLAQGLKRKYEHYLGIFYIMYYIIILYFLYYVSSSWFDCCCTPPTSEIQYVNQRVKKLFFPAQRSKAI